MVNQPHQIADLVEDHRIGDRPGSDRAVGACPVAVGPRGDLAALLAQDPADRLDRVALGPQIVDECDDQRLRGSSAPAKKIGALRRISLSSSSRRTRALSSLISPNSSDVAPRRRPGFRRR
jgi:hypothetical protein